MGDMGNMEIDESQQTESPADEVATLKKEVEALRERNLRLTAEMRNQLVRLQREKEESLRYAESAFAKQLLGVLDNLDRAVDATASATDPQTVAAGVKIVHEQFLKVLADHGIESILAEGQPFNPDVHEAVMQQPSADVQPGTVLQQLARGYQMHGRVLRPAKVIVSRSAD
ncbi:MAG: nucleotide exchange factor GrpE [Phycisphaerales bacterium]|nr:nucleotide exchange factor GrpE [Phycisphaerales bacterium]